MNCADNTDIITKSPAGLLYSQIGYDLGWPKRALVRGPQAFLPEDGATFIVTEENGEIVFRGPLQAWGDIWGSRWWIADFSAIERSGRFRLAVDDCPHFVSEPFDIGNDLLWDRTWLLTGPDQAERRRWFARDGLGWYDAGMEWQEANSHAAYIDGFCDLLEFASARLSPAERTRVEAQIVNGADYLARLQDLADPLDGGSGALVHQVWRFQTVILPGDASKAALAWARAARWLSDSQKEKKADYLLRAERAMAWLRTASPLGDTGFTRIAHGYPKDRLVPEAWMTRDLLMQCRAAVELSLAGLDGYQDEAVGLAARVLARQVPRTKPEGTLYGHFYLFDCEDVTEKSWIHNAASGMGADNGGQYPHYILPLIRLLDNWPNHPDAARWEQGLRDFAYGYFLPACRANPFALMPLGWYQDQGLLWFAGLWHGMNATYAWTAALARELEWFFKDPQFRDIAAGNLQWIAGLNAGITSVGLHASVMFSMEVPDNIALPVSMIHGVGSRSAGSWLNIRGSICNGFCAGKQFVFDVATTAENDANQTFTDEDWITHAGAWLSALARMTCACPSW